MRLLQLLRWLPEMFCGRCSSWTARPKSVAPVLLHRDSYRDHSGASSPQEQCGSGLPRLFGVRITQSSVLLNHRRDLWIGTTPSGQTLRVNVAGAGLQVHVGPKVQPSGRRYKGTRQKLRAVRRPRGEPERLCPASERPTAPPAIRGLPGAAPLGAALLGAAERPGEANPVRGRGRSEP